MFLEMFAWIILAILLGKGTIVYILLMAIGLRKYNIGGVPNHWFKKILLVIGAIFIGYLWYLMWQHFPYEFIPKNTEVVKKVS